MFPFGAANPWQGFKLMRGFFTVGSPSVTLGTRGLAPPNPVAEGASGAGWGSLKSKRGSQGSGMGRTRSLALNLRSGLLRSAPA